MGARNRKDEAFWFRNLEMVGVEHRADGFGVGMILAVAETPLNGVAQVS